ncbi:hypothetical protein [Paraburkholderia caffeinilytica]
MVMGYGVDFFAFGGGWFFARLRGWGFWGVCLFGGFLSVGFVVVAFF